MKTNVTHSGPCVYSILNTIENKVYVGSTIDYQLRIRSHLYNLRAGTHYNVRLQQDYIRLGECAFTFKYITPVTIDNKNEKERNFIKSLNAFYNKNNNNPHTHVFKKWRKFRLHGDFAAIENQNKLNRGIVRIAFHRCRCSKDVFKAISDFYNKRMENTPKGTRKFLRLTPHTWKGLTRLAQKERRPLNQYIKLLLEDHVKNK
jgi:group I intron endonuclease